MVPNLSQRGPTHDLVVSEGGDIAWAIRKNSPELKSELNAFINEHRDTTSFGATIRWRYFVDKRFVKNALDENEARKFVAVIDLFRRYGAQYNFDYLMIAAQAYQESQLDQSRRGAAGGVGLMQIKPSTPAGKPIGITGVDRDPDRNVHAGCAYLRHLADTYVSDPAIDPMTAVSSCFPRNVTLESPVGGMASSAPYAKIDYPIRALAYICTEPHAVATVGTGIGRPETRGELTELTAGQARSERARSMGSAETFQVQQASARSPADRRQTSAD